MNCSVRRLQVYKLQLPMRQQMANAAYRSRVLEQTYGYHPMTGSSMLPFIDGYMVIGDKVRRTNTGQQVIWRKASERESDGGGRPCFGRRQARPGSGFFSAGGSVASQEPKPSDKASSHSIVSLYVILASDLCTFTSGNLDDLVLTSTLSGEAQSNRKIKSVLMRLMARTGAHQLPAVSCISEWIPKDGPGNTRPWRHEQGQKQARHNTRSSLAGLYMLLMSRVCLLRWRIIPDPSLW